MVSWTTFQLARLVNLKLVRILLPGNLVRMHFMLTRWPDFLAHLKSSEAGVLNDIRTQGALSKELEAKLRQVVGDFVKSFL